MEGGARGGPGGAGGGPGGAGGGPGGGGNGDGGGWGEFWEHVFKELWNDIQDFVGPDEPFEVETERAVVGVRG